MKSAIKTGTPIKTSIVVLSLILLVTAGGSAQGLQLLDVLTSDGEAYIYHNHQASAGTGYHLYRVSVNGEERITALPVYPAGNGQEFAYLTSGIYAELEASFNLNNPQAVFLRLIGDPELSFLLSLAHPEIALALGRLHIDSEPVTGSQVTYRFEWVDGSGQPTGEVTEGTVNLNTHTISQPTNLRATRTGSVLKLEWNYPPMTRAMEDRVIRFAVRIKTENSDSFTPIGDAFILRQSETTNFETFVTADASLSSATFVVEAVDVTGKGRSASEETMIALQDVSQPSPVLEVYSVITGDRHISLTWAVSPEPFVQGYHIDRVDSETGEQVRLTETLIPLLGNTYTDTTAVEGKSYRYSIAAVTEAGVEGPRGNPAIIRLPFMTPPPSPAGLTAVWNDNESIDLSWQYHAETERFQSFVVLRRPVTPAGDQAFTQINLEQLSLTRLTDTGIAGVGFVEGRFYEYGVTASDRDGLQSDTIFTMIQVPDLTPPDPPESLTAEVAAGTRIQLNWAASVSGDAVTYSIYRSTNEGDLQKVAGLPRSRLFWIDSAVETGQGYQYRISATDSAGNEGPTTAAVDVYLAGTSPPRAVRNIQAVAGSDGTRLRWEPVPDASVTGYIIMRSELANGRYTEVSEHAADATEWTDTGGRAGNWYRVVAVNADGGRSTGGSPAQAVN